MYSIYIYREVLARMFLINLGLNNSICIPTKLNKKFQLCQKIISILKMISCLSEILKNLGTESIPSNYS